MNRPQAGFTLIEVLVSIVLFAVIIALVLPLFLTSIQSNQSSRLRTTATSVAESWLDRYRSGQEPLLAGGPCTSSTGSVVSTGTVITCTYPTGFNYATDGIPSHTSDAATLAQRFGPYANTIRGTVINSGINTQLWEVQATVKPSASTAGGGNLAIITTRFTK